MVSPRSSPPPSAWPRRVWGERVAALLALLAAGCAPSSSGAPDAAPADQSLFSVSDDQFTPIDLPLPLDSALALADLIPSSDLGDPDPYPAGPYGTAEGDVVPDFHFAGYYDVTGVWPASLLPFGDVSFRQLRRSGARYLFIATGSYW